MLILSLVNVGPEVLRSWYVTAILERNSLLTSPADDQRRTRLVT